MPTETKSFQKTVLEIIAASPTKITPAALGKILSETYDLKRKQIKSVVKDLVAGGDLTYAYEHGDTFLERSFKKPVRISKSVVIKPPGCHYQSRPGEKDVVIQINSGASFGDGRHPTTRLAVRVIEFVLKQCDVDHPDHQRTVLDIGTGTGILVLTAVGLGIHNGIGIDIDPCARSEAKENILINGLEDRIEILDQYLETLDQSFSLVTANLRFPTLKKNCSWLRKITVSKGFIVLSGIRSHELADLINTYSRKGFERLWQDNELDWGGVVFRKLK
jgi:ribosomal protein L11 methyltransferase